ncbi:uncharacterized protein VDAG_01463 [Verticillium dahliae VdLs.17]|uniref:Uncharacterized protein n=1 Tax=Verticillium dahliae (strain VdLs.17 / ATCC MYA-4575 / FGSC 10137) TaxID=498257 RepID=G2WUJ0_VERDV|nr:uncharacterized protein VDAG_01463 [Verticillium dahliae VdLs.17]EGY17781.1 hypothetical protein VDAG_01463 [Verticillium dahliae VdLs.17]
MDSWGWMNPHNDLWARDDGSANGIGNTNGGSTNSFAGQNNDTSQAALINEFRFAAAKSIRTSVIILAAFNVVAAFATAVGIIWHSYATKKRKDPRFKFLCVGINGRAMRRLVKLTCTRACGFTFVAPAETFPLVLSVGIVVQGITFAVAQSTGLKSMLILGCTTTSQMMLPAVFIVPYIQFVFGLEVTSRALRQQPFAGRGKWTVAGCLAIVGTLLLVTFVVTLFIRPPNFCFGSLFWFVQRWKAGVFILLIVIAATLLVCTVIIAWRLHNNCQIDESERVAASRMVYYLTMAIISTVFMIPFFYTIVFNDLRTAGSQPLNLSMIASVVANLSGLLTGGLHLFLRANCLATIGAREQCEKDRKKLKEGIRVWPGDYDYNSNAGSPSRSRAPERLDSSVAYGKMEEERIESPTGTPTYDSRNAPRLPALRPPTVPSGPTIVEPTPPASTLQVIKDQIRKSTYSLFPRDSSGARSFTLLPATTYSPNATTPRGEKFIDNDDDMQSLVPPPLVHAGGVRHRRDSSMHSHATVQIGLRFSNAEDAPALNSRYFRDSEEVHVLGCPLEREKDGSKRPSPLNAAVTNSYDGESTLIGSSAARDSGPTLNSAVYTPFSPKSRITSPKGVGFDTPKRMASLQRAGKERCYKPDCDCDLLHKPDWI